MTQTSIEIWSRGQNDPLAIANAVLYSRLADAIAWCASILADKTVDAAMRTPDLQPRLLHDGPDDVICDVGSTRHWRVRATTDAPQASMPELNGGRLLCYFPDADLCDGAAEQESDGFFDVYNTPPWDTWVGYFCDGTDPNGSYDNYSSRWLPVELWSTQKNASCGLKTPMLNCGHVCRTCNPQRTPTNIAVNRSGEVGRF